MLNNELLQQRGFPAFPAASLSDKKIHRYTKETSTGLQDMRQSEGRSL